MLNQIGRTNRREETINANSNVVIVQEGYAVFARGDVPAFLNLMDANVVCDIPGAPDFLGQTLFVGIPASNSAFQFWIQSSKLKHLNQEPSSQRVTK